MEYSLSYYHLLRDLSLSYTTTGSMVTIFIAAVAVTIISGPVIDISKIYTSAILMFDIRSIFPRTSGATSTLILATAAVFIGICVSGWHTPSIPYLSLLYNKKRLSPITTHCRCKSWRWDCATNEANYAGPVGQQTSLLLALPVAIMGFYV